MFIAPGLVLIAPGISSVRLAKLRPFSGSDVSLVEVIVSPVAVDSVWRIGATPVTSTVCVISPSSIFTSTRAI